MKHCASLARAQIPCANARFVVTEVVESGEVALRQIKDMDIIANRGAVVGGIVCAKLCQNSVSIRAIMEGHCCRTVTKDE